MTTRKELSTNSINRKELIDFCGIVYSMDILSGRWKMVILDKLSNKQLRYNEIKQLLPNVTDRMLSLHLKEMEKDGLITRSALAEVPVKVSYGLTESAKALVPVWQALDTWGRAHRILMTENEGEEIKISSQI